MKHPASVDAYLQRIGAEVLNFRRAMIKIYRGNYYIERAIIKISDDGTVTSSVKDFAPTDEEAKAMKDELSKITFPKTIKAKSTSGLKGLIKGEMYAFIDRKDGGIIMVQERRINSDGKKSYIPWTFFSDGQWASMEPDGDLPFWKPEERKGPGARIMIHEGAKAAAHIDKVVREKADHPWLEELSQYEHWGMIGGALAPHRTDYEELFAEKPTEVVYVCDNDQPGLSALQKVSRAWGRSLRGVVFGQKFPTSWDMADDMPPELFTKSGRYIGPRIKDLIEPATFATDLIPQPEGKGRPLTVMRHTFAEEWMHCIQPEVFVHRDWPNRILSGPEFNSRVAPFSHVDDTARILKKEFASKAAVLKYNPGEPSGVFSGSKSGLYINTFCPSDIEPEKGDVRPFLEYMEKLCPNEGDRFNLMRWCATLIARPEIRMLWGVLMISEMQGIGKGTLGEKILAPLVGEINVSYPSEQEIVDSNYNYWLAHKRLAVVHEIYAGHSSKAYNKLKSCITDRYVTVQKKYQANYEIENWVHIFACSNSMRAMKLSMDDRRWFVPRLSEERRPAEYWEAFNGWLQFGGGLGIIKQWAEDFVKEHKPVERGSAAPWSALKKTIVEESYSPGQALAARALDAIKDQIAEGKLPANSFVLDTDVVELIRDQLYNGQQNDRLERPGTIRTLAKSQGWAIGEVRAQIKAWGAHTIGGRVMSLDPAVAARAPSELGGEKLPPSERMAPLDIRQMLAM